ncbi:MAG: hypothetical protein KQH63_11640 [Desulfobulbaceae bacterium]|nr:hypothetical protein [Desulfobulbaceae bacterium]
MNSSSSLICYCYNYSAEDILQDVREYGYSKIMEKIMASKKSGNCNCAKLNPSGR